MNFAFNIILDDKGQLLANAKTPTHPHLQIANFMISLSWLWKFTELSKTLGPTETTSMDKYVVVCKNLSPELSPNLAKVSEGEMCTKPMEGDSCIPCLKKMQVSTHPNHNIVPSANS